MNMGNMLNKMFGQIEPGLCRLSMNGGIAIKVGPSEYKSYNVETGRLTNCSSFVFDIGEEFFFVIPTNKVSIGDIILVNGEPRCVVKASKDEITVINYKTSVKETILPERHVFMGSTYFYGKIVSMFGNGAKGKGKGKKNIFKYMMMSEMLKGSNTHGIPGEADGMGGMARMFMMSQMFGNGGMGDMFEDMFDFDLEDDESEDESTPYMKNPRGRKPRAKAETSEDAGDEEE